MKKICLGKEKRGLGLFYGIFSFASRDEMEPNKKNKQNSGMSCPGFCVFLLASIGRVGCFLLKNSYLLAPDSFFVEMIEIDYNLYEPFILVDFDTSYTEVCKLRIVMV